MMKRLIYLILILFVAFTASWVFAGEIPGSQFYYLGNGISYFPLGASGVSHFMTMDANLYNPAAYADTKRITTDLSLGGLGGSNFLMNVRGSFPTTIGVITGNFLMLNSLPGLTAGDVYGVKATFSKAISEEWLFGAGVNLGYAQGPEEDFLASLDIGTIYHKTRSGTGFGLFDYSIGGAVKNLGKNISYTGYDSFPPLAVDLGGNLEFVRAGFYKARIGTHVMVPFNPFNFFVGLGLENVFFDMVNVKLGVNLGVEEVDPVSVGVDVGFKIEDTDFQISYSLLPTNFNGRKEYTHNAGISVAFGKYDTKPPETSVSVEDIYFSPNHDGVKDKELLTLDISDNTMVFGWRLDITDADGKPVKAWEAEDVRKIRYMTIEKYVSRIFAKKEEVKIPKAIEWDGEDSEGNVVPDGVYYYTLTAWDENNNKTVTEKRKLIVDTVVPLVEAKSELMLFSPNDDGVKDTLTFAIKSANIEDQDKVVLSIADKKGNNVVKKEYEGSCPREFVWDGTDNAGASVPEGVYTFSLNAVDKAGNSSSVSIENIVVRTEYEKISVTPSLRAFSPNGDGYFDIDEIKLFSSSKEGLLDWNLAILDESGQVRREYSGKKDFQEIISFDGKDASGRVLPDGLYTLRFRLYFDSGNHPESYFKFLRIDNTAPDIEVSSNISAFSPNGDGSKDTISFIHKIKADTGDSFEAQIVGSNGAIFKSFQYGQNPPGVVVWDGMGDNNTQPVEGTYTYVIIGKDDVGNSTRKTLGPIKLVTGFEEVSVEPLLYAFSPNSDSIDDTETFEINASSRDGITQWRMDIRNKEGDLIKTFSSREMGTRLPEEIMWDGKSEVGNVVQDGLYTTLLTVQYDTGNNPISKPKDVKLDTAAPVIELYVPDLYISPNNDGAKETITIYQKVQGEADDIYKARIVDSSEEPVKEFEWKGTPPTEIVWDGRDQNGKPLSEGLYAYAISGRDAAGNSSQNRISDIVLVTSYEKVGISADQKGISPNGDGFFETVQFTPSVSSTKDLLEWKLGIQDPQGKELRALKGTGEPPLRIEWNGKDNSGVVVPDGKYTYAISLKYKSGNHPISDYKQLIVDTTPPNYLFVVSPVLFSPDGDGEADTMYINVELDDQNGVSDWQISIYRKWDSKVDRTTPFKRFSGKGSYRDKIVWDGYSDPVQVPTGFTPPDQYTYKKKGDKWVMLVDSAASYVVELDAYDIYRNRTYVKRGFDTDILVIKTPYGLKIMINSIQFEFDKADLRPESFPILDRLIEILEKFPNYRVDIVGHTDWIGTEEYNQGLSERRAYSVYKYLVENDVDRDRLTTEGRGETQPIDDNNTEIGRSRNRRVEFYLTKKPE
jgi:outer membrane protein OmpA-like peptidoglycan-associated protein/flagellar hook assembly protein FlgD